MTHRVAFLLSLITAPVIAQSTISVRRTAPPVAATSEGLGTIFSLREMADGRVLVSDAGKRRLLMFSADLKTFETLSDTSAASKNKYGDSPALLIPYIGDSTLFSPFGIPGFQVIDPRGEIGRVTAPPKANDLSLIRRSRTLSDPRGRIVYRATHPRIAIQRPDPGAPVVSQAPDSSPVVRADFETRALDTIGYVRIPKPDRKVSTPAAAGSAEVPSSRVFLAPISTVDDWTMLPDGTVALVRGSDYHIDWVAPDGRVTSAPKMAFDWRRIGDEEKQRLSDSTVASWRKALEGAKERQGPPRPVPGGGMTFSVVGKLNDDGSMTSMSTNSIVETFPFNEWPDYYPPVRVNTTLADADGNVWILPMTSSQSKSGGVVYDVVNQKDGLYERVEMPADRSIAGFGRNGAVYLMWRDSASVWHLEKTRVVK